VGSHDFLDLTALGRQEVWEEPKGRSTDAHSDHEYVDSTAADVDDSDVPEDDDEDEDDIAD
jgi:hypothetical protein